MLNKIYRIPFIHMPLRWLLSYVNAYIQPHFIRDKFLYLKKIKNKHSGQRCFIVATGPSLKIDDLELIKNEISFSCNSIVKLLDNTQWRPDYYVMFDKEVYFKIKDDIIKSKSSIKNFFHPYDWDYDGDNSRPYILKRDTWYSQKEKRFLRKYFGTKLRFSKDISNVVYRGGSVVHIMIQLAYYMGFKEVYLLGCDLNFLGDNLHAKGLSYSVSPNFSPENAKKEMLEDYVLDKKVFEADKRSIYNVTRGGFLEVYNRVNLEDILSNN